MTENDRMTGADAGVCAACLGSGDRHICEKSEPARARLLAEEEVEQMESEGVK